MFRSNARTAAIILLTIYLHSAAKGRHSGAVYLIILFLLIAGSDKVFFKVLGSYQEVRSYIREHTLSDRPLLSCILSPKCLLDCSLYAKPTFLDCSTMYPFNYLVAVKSELVPYHEIRSLITAREGVSLVIIYRVDHEKPTSNYFTDPMIAQHIYMYEYRYNPLVWYIDSPDDYALASSMKENGHYLLYGPDSVAMLFSGLLSIGRSRSQRFETYSEGMYLHLFNNTYSGNN